MERGGGRRADLSFFALFPGRRFAALLFGRLELAQRVGGVIHFVQHHAADQDGRLLLDGHGDAIARTGVQFDDLLLVQFVFRRNDEAGVKRAVLHVVDDRAFDFGPESGQHMGHEVVGQRTLLLRPGKEHVDGVADGRIDINDERFLLGAEEQRRAVGRRDNGLELHGDHGLLRHQKQTTPAPRPNPVAKTRAGRRLRARPARGKRAASARMEAVVEFVSTNWTGAVEILLLAVLLYYGYLYFRGTPGAKILVGLALLFISLTLASQLLDLHVIGWLLRSFSVFLAVALVVIFQPELRRALTELGSQHFFRSPLQKKESIDLLVDTVFDLARRQFGALIALERDISIRQFASTGVDLDAVFSKELILTVFHPKTVLHDGGVIVQNDRAAAAACIFPLTAREDLDRSLGLRHRAGIGITEESDAIAILVSEETGHVSLCHRGILERNLSVDRFRRRLNQLLLLEKYETDSPAQLEN